MFPVTALIEYMHIYLSYVYVFVGNLQLKVWVVLDKAGNNHAVADRR